MKTFLKNALIALVLLAILVAFIIVFLITGITVVDGVSYTWPCLLLFYYWSSFCTLDIKQVPKVLVSSALGILAGYTVPFFTMYADGTVALIVELIAVVLLIALGLSAPEFGWSIIDGPCMYLFITVTTCNSWFVTMNNVPQVCISWVLGIGLCCLFGAIMAALAKKGAEKAAAAAETPSEN